MSPPLRPDLSQPLPSARLLADIGGTNARFGWQADRTGPIEQVSTLRCADHATLEDAIRAYLQGAALGVPPTCGIGIATPITGDAVRMTNHHWAFSQRALRERMGFDRLLVINDFTALALAVPVLDASVLRQVGGGAAVAGAAIGVLGPGTGLGVSGLVPRGDDARDGDRRTYLPLQGEGGHVTLAADTAREFAALDVLRRRYGHASAERVVSGQGLLDLCLALCEVDRIAPAPASTAADVTRRALDASDATCVEALQMFCGFLGSVAGNLALTLGAQGGVYIGGGIVPRLGTWFDASPFRARFEAKGRFRDYLAAIPTLVIDANVAPSLLGAARALDSMAGGAA
jgi:glucokinase